MSRLVIEGPYLSDVLDQPRALRDTEAALPVPPLLESLCARLHAGDFTQVILTGMGSSFHALHPARLELTAAGYTSSLVETADLLFHLRPLVKPRTLLVVVSQSGASVEILRLLDQTPADTPIIGVTNTAESPLATRATVSLFTRAGPESTVSCKTYLTALLALSWLASLLCGKDRARVRAELQQAAPATALYLQNWRAHVDALQTQLAGVRTVFLTGRGPSLATAGVGGLILKESTHVPAEGMSSAAFRHGPFEMLHPEVFVAVFRGDASTAALNERLAADVARAGARAALIGEPPTLAPFQWPSAPERIRPLLEMLPVEMMSFALAALNGREAGRFTLGSKITTTE